MVNNSNAQLDRIFAALADGTRRQVLEQLGDSSASVGALAEPHGMSLPGFLKHLAVLEAAGLIARAKEGRVVRCEIVPATLQAAAAWVARYEHFWTQQLDALGRYLHHQRDIDPCQTPLPTPPMSASSATTRTRLPRSGARGPTRKR